MTRRVTKRHAGRAANGASRPPCTAAHRAARQIWLCGYITTRATHKRGVWRKAKKHRIKGHRLRFGLCSCYRRSTMAASLCQPISGRCISLKHGGRWRMLWWRLRHRWRVWHYSFTRADGEKQAASCEKRGAAYHGYAARMRHSGSLLWHLNAYAAPQRYNRSAYVCARFWCIMVVVRHQFVDGWTSGG